MEESLKDFIQRGGRVEDLPMNGALMKKYDELMGYESPEELKKKDDGYTDKIMEQRMKNSKAITDIFKNAKPIKPIQV